MIINSRHCLVIKFCSLGNWSEWELDMRPSSIGKEIKWFDK